MIYIDCQFNEWHNFKVALLNGRLEFLSRPFPKKYEISCWKGSPSRVPSIQYGDGIIFELQTKARESNLQPGSQIVLLLLGVNHLPSPINIDPAE